MENQGNTTNNIHPSESFEIMKILIEIKGDMTNKIITQSQATLKKMDGMEVTIANIRTHLEKTKTYQEGLNARLIATEDRIDERLTRVEERPRRYLKLGGVIASIIGVITAITLGIMKI